MPGPSVVQRLKERKLVQWALAYLAGAWVLMEAADHVVGVFQWPSLVSKVVTILAIFGFFVALVIAWYHGEKGRQWVSGPELLIIALLLMITGGVLRVVGPGPDQGDTLSDAGSNSVMGSTTEADERPSIAVLPFANRSRLEDDLYFTDGIHDQIISQLQEIRSLGVRGRTSVDAYRDSGMTIPAIAQELRVRYILEGGVQRAGDRVQINLQLIDAQVDDHLWAETYDRTLSIENLFDVQGEIARRVAEEIGAVLTPEEEARLGALPTDNLEVYDLYLLGTHQWSLFTEESIRLAMDYFQQAIALDPLFSPAHSGLADCYVTLGFGFGRGAVAPDDAIPLAKASARKAIQLDPENPHGYAVLGLIAIENDYDYPEAERLLNRALELPGDPVYPLGRLAILYSVLGRHEDAIAASRRVMDLAPKHMIAATDYGWHLWRAGRVEEALGAAQRAREIDPQFPEVDYLAGTVLTDLGRYEEAVAALNRLGGFSAENPKIRCALAIAYARMGDRAAAEEILDELLALSEERYVSPKFIGLTYLTLGEDDLALEWFEKGVDIHAGWISDIRHSADIERLRSNPRYQDLMRRMNVEG
jgi:TolB-like protein/Flp pilus assembly protein TadD